MPTVPVPAGPIRHAGGCLQSVLLRGRVDHIDSSTGELIHRYTTVHEPGGLLPVPCKTRRASRCAPCAEVYRADTYQLIRAGLTGGKGVPAEVAHHPCVFVTLTAPSFGPVHARRERGDRVLACRPRRNSRTCPHGASLCCNEKHTRDDDRLGEPLCPECYDYTGAVLFNAHAPELGRRFTITLRRTLARRAGLTGKAFAAQARLCYAKVAEYQRRGVGHFHAIVRLDGPAGPTTAPPASATVALLTDAIGQAARAVQVSTPAAAPRLPSTILTWGGQLDIRPVTPAGELTDTTLAGYVASTPRKPPGAPAPSIAASRPPTAWTSCTSGTTPAATSPNASGSASSPSSPTCGWPPGRTCSASAATSPPRAAPIRSPSAPSVPTAPLTSASAP